VRERLLVGHFLQRFLDHDLVSPDVDRHGILSVAGATLISSGLFVAVLLSVKYLASPFQSPGQTTVVALDDRFLFIAASMILMALVAVAVWDAIAVEGRDASILGPLPIPHGVIVRAKFAALLLFGAAFAAALTVVPSVLHPSLMVAKLPVGVIGALTLIGVHAGVSLAAGAFGFLFVVGVRELLRAVLGAAWFARVSALVQAALVVSLAVTFLLIPALSSHVGRFWFSQDPRVPYFVPPLWFLGLQESLAGGIIDNLPRPPLPPMILEMEHEATVLYRSQRGAFQQLGSVALVALATVAVTAVAAYAWNHRRLRAPAVAQRTKGRAVGAAGRWIAERLVVRRPLARAGFFFTLQTLFRSVPHRLSMATSIALGLAAAAVMLRGVGVRGGDDVAAIPVGLLAVQTVLAMALLAGFRHSIRVPAELGANWTFHLAWAGDHRAYLRGVKRAVLVGVILPVLLAILPLHMLALGSRVALAHFVFGLAIALLVREALLYGFQDLPFASAFQPSGNLQTAGSIYIALFLALAYGLAWVERAVLGAL